MKQAQSLSSGILFMVIVMAIFTFAMFESGDKITGNMVKVSGIGNK